MGSYTHRLSFSARHETADLALMPKTLGLPARFLYKMGEPRVAPDGRKQGGSYKFSYCSFTFEPGADLPSSLTTAIDFLRPHKSFLAELFKSGVKFRFFIGWFSADGNSGEHLEWTLLRDIADLNISLDFDFYCPEVSEIP